MSQSKTLEVVPEFGEMMCVDGSGSFHVCNAPTETGTQLKIMQISLAKLVGKSDKGLTTTNWKSFLKNGGRIQFELKEKDAVEEYGEGNGAVGGRIEIHHKTFSDEITKIIVCFTLGESFEVQSVDSTQDQTSKNSLQVGTIFPKPFPKDSGVSLEVCLQMMVGQGLHLDLNRMHASLVHFKSLENRVGFMNPCTEEEAVFFPAVECVNWITRIKKDKWTQFAYWTSDETGPKLRSLIYVDSDEDRDRTRVTVVSLTYDNLYDYECIKEWLRMRELELEMDEEHGIAIIGLTSTQKHLKELTTEFNSLDISFEPLTRNQLPVPLVLEAYNFQEMDSMKEKIRDFDWKKIDLTYLAFNSIQMFGKGNGLGKHRVAILTHPSTNPETYLNDPALHLGRKEKLNGAPRVTFLFSGIGTAHTKMGKELFHTFPTFAHHMTHFHHYLVSTYKIPLLKIMFSDVVDEKANLLLDPVISHAALYVFGISLAWLWESWGVVPDVVIGHSLGETMAAVLSGILSPRQGLDLVVLRGKLLKEHGAEGSLVAIRASAQQTEALLSEGEGGLEIVGFNSPTQTVVGGRVDQVDTFMAFCANKGVTAKQLQVSRSYHSKSLKSSLAHLAMEYEKEGKTYRSCKISTGNPTFISSLPLPNRFCKDLDLIHWQSVVSEEVDWIGAIRDFETEYPDVGILLEIGPKPTLGSLTEEILANGKEFICIPSIFNQNFPVDSILEAAGKLWTGGIEIEWEKVLSSYSGNNFTEDNFTQNLFCSDADVEKLIPHPTPEFENPSDLDFESIRRIVEFCFSKVLEMDGIDGDELVGSLGITSASALEIRNEIQGRLGGIKRLPPTLLFDSPSINSVAHSIEATLRNASTSPQTFPKKYPQKDAPKNLALLSSALRLPNGVSTPEGFWDVLSQPQDLSTEIPKSRFDHNEYFGGRRLATKFGCFLDDSVFASFDSGFFGMSGRETEVLDPQQRLLLECTWEALERAGIPPNSLTETKTGVFMGLCHRDFLEVLEATGSSGSVYVATGNYLSTASGRISFLLKSRGPSLTVDTACSSSLSAFHLACQSLLDGESDLAIVGGVNLILSPYPFLRYSDGGMLSVDGHCKTWDVAGNGYVRGEGCGVVILRRLEEAVDLGGPIVAVVRGSAMNSDGHAASLTTPNTHSQQRLIRDALQKSGLRAEQIGYLEIHGTGTKLGDAQEYATLKGVYGNLERSHPLIVGSSKTCIGHLEPASGILALVKATLCLQKKQVPRHQNFQNLNIHMEDSSFFVLPVGDDGTMAWESEFPRITGINNFGSSGTNVHVILQEWTGHNEKQLTQTANGLLTVSAKSPSALSSLVHSWSLYLKQKLHDPAALLSAAFTSNFGRAHYKWRAVAQLAKNGGLSDFTFGIGVRLPLVYKIEFHPNKTLNSKFLSSLYAEFPRFANIVNLIEYESQKCIGADFSFVDGILEHLTFLVPSYAKYFCFCSQVALGRFILEMGLIPQNMIPDSHESNVVCQVLQKSLDFNSGILLLQKEGEFIPPTIEIPPSALVIYFLSAGWLSCYKVMEGKSESLCDPVEKSKRKWDMMGEGGTLWDVVSDAYLSGVEIDFSVVESDRLEIDSQAPTYAFDRIPYPLPKFPCRALEKTPMDSIEMEEFGQFYTIQWIPESLPQNPNLVAGDWLIINFGDSSPLSFGSRISRILNGKLMNVFDEDGNLLQPSNPVLQNETLPHVAFVLDNSADMESDTFELKVYQESLFRLALAVLQKEQPLDSFVLLTQGMVDNPFMGALRGGLNVICSECSHIRIQHLDFDLGGDDIEEEEEGLMEGVRAVRDELVSGWNNDFCVHYSKTLRRSVQRLLPIGSEKLLKSRPEYRRHFDPEKIYIVSGGCGDIGSSITTWILENGGGEVWILSRNPQKDAFNTSFKERIKLFKGNVGKWEDVKGVFDCLKSEVNERGFSLGGIFHIAGTVAPKLFRDCDWSDFESMFETKVYGAWNLHLGSLEYSKSLDHFMLFSSITSVFPMRGLATYASGNAFLNALAEYRGSVDLPGQSLLLSHIHGGIGIKFDDKHNGRGWAELIDRLSIQELIQIFPTALANPDERQLLIGNFNWAEYAQLKIKEVPLFASILEKFHCEIKSCCPPPKSTSIQYSTIGEVRKCVTQMLVAVGKFPENGLDESEGFGNLGLDSLMLMEFRDLIDEEFGELIPIPTLITFNYPTVETLSNFIHRLIHSPDERIVSKVKIQAVPPGSINPISIVGMSCRFGGEVDGIDSYWEMLVNAESGIRPTPTHRYPIQDYFDPDSRTPGKMYCSGGGYIEDVDCFDGGFFGITPREAAVLDPQHRLLLEGVWHALEHAGIPVSSVFETKTGIFIGISGSEFGGKIPSNGNPNFLTGTHPAAASGRVAHFLGTLGPAISVDTACSSSLVALHLAVQSLRNGETELALVGGVSLTLFPEMSMVICKAGMLSRDNTCWTFDERANGYVRGEGMGWLVLKRLIDAESGGNRILAILRGISVNSDGASSSLTTPNGISQWNLIQEGLTTSFLTPNDLDYIEAHGSATPIGDGIELQTLNQLASCRSISTPLWIGCAKVNVGHTEIAAGMAGIIKILLQLQHNTIPPHRNFKTLNPLLHNPSPSLRIPLSPINWAPGEGRKRRAGISCFGFSGTNVFGIIEEYEPAGKAALEGGTRKPRDLITLSAKFLPSMEALIAKMEGILNKCSELECHEMSYTMNVGRSLLSPFRLAVSYTSKVELGLKLQNKEYEICSNPGSSFEMTIAFGNPLDSSLEAYKEVLLICPLYQRRVEEAMKLSQSEIELWNEKWKEISLFLLEFAWIDTCLIVIGVETPLRIITNGSPGSNLLGALFAKVITFPDALRIISEFPKYQTFNFGETPAPSCFLVSTLSGPFENFPSFMNETLTESSTVGKSVPELFETVNDKAVKCVVIGFGKEFLSSSQLKEHLGCSALLHWSDGNSPLWTFLTDLMSELYSNGWSFLNWLGYYEGCALKISHLAPLYPFQKVRHTIEMESNAIRELSSTDITFNIANSAEETEKPSGQMYKVINSTPDEIRTLVISSISDVTGYPESILDPELGFVEMGLHSQMGLEVREKLGLSLSESSPDEGGGSVSLPPTLLLDYPNINRLTKYLYSLVVGNLDECLPQSEQAQRIGNQPLSTPTQREGDGREVAIVGMSCNFPGSPNLDAYWSTLISQGDLSSEVPYSRFDGTRYLREGVIYSAAGCWIDGVDEFDPEFFGISTKEAILLDPQQRLLLECVWSALESGSISAESLRGTKTGVYVGLTNSDYSELIKEEVSMYSSTGNNASTASGRISYFLALHGPSLSINTACSSSLVAAHYAVVDLQSGRTEGAIVGGVNLCLTPGPFIELCQGEMLSREGHCRTWDSGADGYVRGEGAGVVLLKRLSDCVPGRDRVLGIIRSSVLNQDGPSSSLTTPNSLAQVELMRSALEEARLSPGDVSFLEIHGTGTKLGDAQEASAVSAVFSSFHSEENPLFIGTAKTSIGHLESAAGVAGLIKILLSLQNRVIPPHKNFTLLNPTIVEKNYFRLPSSAQSWEGKSPLRAGINSFGFSGTNAHLILEEPSIEFRTDLPRDILSSYLLTISGKTEGSLWLLASEWHKYLSKVDSAVFQHFCYTSGVGRGHYKYRLGIRSRSLKECLGELEGWLDTRPQIPVINPNKLPKVVFLFTGQGALYSGMCRDLYFSQAGFRSGIEECGEWTQGRIPMSLQSLLWDPTFASFLKSDEYAQISTFVIEYSLARMWLEVGVRPSAVIGHSIGEFAGAVLAGVMDLQTALALVLSRGKLMGGLGSAGGMVAVGSSEAAVRNLFHEFNQSGLEFAAFNSPRQTVVAGPLDVVQGFAEFCKERKLRAKVLDVSKPFHSAGMLRAAKAFETFCKDFHFNSTDPAMKFVSTSTGTLKWDDFSPSYWSSQIVNPVRFISAIQNGVRSFKADERLIFIEVGPDGVLTPSVPLSLPEISHKPINLSSVRREEENWTSLLKVVETLWGFGIYINFQKLYEGASSAGKLVRVFDLPQTPMQKRRIWVTDAKVKRSKSDMSPNLQNVSLSPIQGQQLRNSTTDVLKFGISLEDIWREREYLKDHQVNDSILFPGAAFIVVMFQICQENISKNDRLLKLENISFESPLIYNPDEVSSSSKLISAYYMDSNTLEITTTRIHARSTFSADLIPHPSPLLELRLDEMMDGREISASDFYAFCHRNGFNYGSHFQAIKELRLGKNEGLASISLPPGVEDESELILHPVILDGAFQTLILAQLQDVLVSYGGSMETAITVASEPYLPFTIQSLTVLREPVPRRVVVHAKWSGSQAPNTIQGELTLWNPTDNSLLALIKGFQARRLTPSQGKSKLTQIPSEELDPLKFLFREEWSKDTSLDFKNLDLSHIHNTIIPEFMASSEIIEKIQIETLVLSSWLEDLSLLYFLRLVEGVLIPRGLLSSHSTQDFINAAFPSLSPHLRILIEFTIGVMEKRGILESNHFDSSAVSHLSAEWEKGTIETIRSSYPEYISTLDLIWRCGQELENVVLGVTDPLELLFPAEGSEFEHISAGEQYRTCPQMSIANGAIVSLIQSVLTSTLGSREGEGKLIILEIGAGTGGSTRHALKTLSAFPNLTFSYTYTDISKFFFAPASVFCEELKGARGSMLFRTLNIESDPGPQGYELHSYDLILATNVLHATKNISQTLAHVRRLLVPDGLLICCEGTRPSLGLDITFGLVDGWWRFWDEDPLRRKENPLMGREVWEYALQENGFTRVVSMDLHQSVFLSQASKINSQPIKEFHSKEASPDWLIIQHNSQKCDYLFELLESRGQKLQIVSNGSVISVEEYLELLNNSTKSKELNGILYLKGLESSVFECHSPESVREFSELIIQDFLHFCQALSLAVNVGLRMREKVIVMVSGVVSVGVQDTTVINPFLSTLWGMTKTLGRELSGSGVTVIGIDLDSLNPLSLTRLGTEFWNQRVPIGGHFSVRNGIKYNPKLVQSPGKDSSLSVPASQCVQLILPESLSIESLEIVAQELKTDLAPDEIEVEVHSAGINFKHLLARMDDSIESFSFGADFSGRVLRLGSRASESYTVGEEVVGIAQNPYATTALSLLGRIARKPERVSLSEAVGIPASGVTAYLGLIRVGKLRRGKRVLIHSAAGGVGLNGIRLCAYFGAEVIATVSSEAKREVLRGMGVTQIYSSRDLSWMDACQEKVDIVLNTLTGPGAIQSSLSLLRRSGVFVELSKRNIWNREEMAKIRPDVVYHILDLDHLIYKTSTYKTLLDDTCALYSKDLDCIPVRSYPLNRAVAAFKQMLTGKHIGKLALSPAVVRGVWGSVLEGTYVIAGGSSGIGITIAQWLLNQSPNVVLVLFSRSLNREMEAIKESSSRVHVILGSVSNFNDCRHMIFLLKSNPLFPPIRGVIHSAGTLADCLYPSQSWGKYEAVFSPKVYGAWYLHVLTRDLPLAHFVVFSSAGSYLGTPGQSPHVSASAFMDGLINYRRRNGYVGNSLLWGPWAEVGAVAGIESLGPGLDFIQPSTATALMDILLRDNAQETLVVNFNWSKFIPANPSLSAFWVGDIQALIGGDNSGSDDKSGIDIQQPIDPTGLDRNEIQEMIGIMVLGHTSKSTGTPISHIDPNEGFTNLGLDSLMALDLRNNLQKVIPPGCHLSNTVIFDYPTVTSLSKYILGVVEGVYSFEKGAGAVNVAEKIGSKEESLEKEISDSSVAIIGMSCRFPGARSPEEYWDLLSNGTVTATSVPSSRFHFKQGECYTDIGNFIPSIDEFDHRFFNLSPKEAQLMDPQHRLLLECVWEALEDAGIPANEIEGSRTAVFVGISSKDYWEVLGSESGLYVATGNAGSCAAGRISYHYDFLGPSMSIDTACSSSLVALHMAAKTLESGEADLGIVGGVNLVLTSSLYLSFCDGNMLSRVGISRPFDQGADGFVRGEGLGVVILRRVDADGRSRGVNLNLPPTRPLAYVRSSAVNSDGHSSGYTVPNGQAQERLIREALERGRLKASQVSYVESHGSSTQLGDVIEMNALGRVFGEEREEPLLISSAKANIGHLEAASGMAGLIKVILSMQNGRIPKHPTFHTLNPLISAEGFFEIPTHAVDWSTQKELVAGVSSFGFSGTNAHVILVSPQIMKSEPSPNLIHQSDPFKPIIRPTLLTLSARTESSLISTVSHFIKYFESVLTLDKFQDVVYTLNRRRNQFRGARLGVVASTPTEAIKRLMSAAASGISTTPSQPFKLVFCLGNLSAAKFPKSLGKELYEASPGFSRSLNKISDVVKSLKIPLEEGVDSLIELLFGSERFGLGHRPTKPNKLSKDLRAFAISYAFSKLWEAEFGISPHSIVAVGGVAELVGGAFGELVSLKDALRLLANMGNVEPKASSGKYTVISGLNGKKIRNFKDFSLDFSSEEKEGTSLLDKAIEMSRGTSFLSISPGTPEFPENQFLQGIGSDGDEWTHTLSTLSTLYESGMDIPWEHFYRENVIHSSVSSLPKYTFERSRHWFTPNALAVKTIETSLKKPCIHPFLGERVLTSPRRTYFQNPQFKLQDALDVSLMTESVLVALISILKATQSLAFEMSHFELTLLQNRPNLELITIWQTSIEKTSVSTFTVDCNYKINDDWHSAFSCNIKQLLENGKSEGVSGLQEFKGKLKIPDEQNLGIEILRDTLQMIAGERKIKNMGRVTIKIFPPPPSANVFRAFEEEEEKLIQVVVLSNTKGRQVLLQIHDLELFEDQEFMNLPNFEEPFELFSDASDHILEICAKSDEIPTSTFLKMDEIGVLYILQALDKLGICEAMDRIGRDGHKIYIPEIVAKFRIVSKHSYLMTHIFRTLVSLGYLDGNEIDGYNRNSSPWPFRIEEIEVKLGDLVSEIEMTGSEVSLCHLLRQCASQLDFILTGVQDPIKLLFPTNPSLISAADVYKESSDLLKGYNTISTLFSSLNHSSRKYRILEIGAGTGGTTRHIYETLKKESIDFSYVFTDLSPFFFRDARVEFGKDPRFIFCKFDVESAPAPQGFELASFDIVVASNVLHATRDLGETLENVMALLKYGSGVLLLCESSDRRLACDLTFGLLDGWWAFGSGEVKCKHRTDYPLLNGGGWDRVLRQTGFSDTLIIPGSQGVYVAKAGGEKNSLLATRMGSNDNTLCVTRQSEEVRLEHTSLLDILTDKSSAQGDQKRIRANIKILLSDITGIATSDLSDEDVFTDLGMDSLMTIDLQGRLESILALSPFGSILSPKAVFDHSSIPTLTHYFIELKQSLNL